MNTKKFFPKLLSLSLLATLTCLLAAQLTHAHHSFGFYDQEARVLSGKITKVNWRNPHVHLTLSVALNDNTSEEWTLEGGASYVLKRRGIERELFAVGSQVQVAGRAHSRDKGLMLLQNVLLPSGEELLMAGGVEPRWSKTTEGRDENVAVVDTARQDKKLFRVWSIPFLRPITYGEDLPYLETPEGGRQWIDRLNDYAERCEAVGMPGIMATPYPVEIIENRNAMQLKGFSNNAPFTRTIFLQAPGSENEPSDLRMGISLGRWESENLLIVTTRHISWPYFDDTNGTPQSDQMLVTERFTLSDDQSRLDYQMSLNDPTLFRDSVTVIESYWVALDEALIFPESCAN